MKVSISLLPAFIPLFRALSVAYTIVRTQVIVFLISCSKFPAFFPSLDSADFPQFFPF